MVNAFQPAVSPPQAQLAHSLLGFLHCVRCSGTSAAQLLAQATYHYLLRSFLFRPASGPRPARRRLAGRPEPDR